MSELPRTQEEATMHDPMVGKVLRRAAEIVREGWCQGAYARDAAGCALVSEHRSGAVAWCAEGALGRATRELRVDHDVTAQAWARAILAVPGNASVFEFNDAPGRTAEEVAALLERAAGEP